MDDESIQVKTTPGPCPQAAGGHVKKKEEKKKNGCRM
jgi:hypothetical protein